MGLPVSNPICCIHEPATYTQVNLPVWPHGFQALHMTMSSRAETMPSAFLNPKHLAQCSHSVNEKGGRKPHRRPILSLSVQSKY